MTTVTYQQVEKRAMELVELIVDCLECGDLKHAESIAKVVERDQLWRACEDERGLPFASFDAFAKHLQAGVKAK